MRHRLSTEYSVVLHKNRKEKTAFMRLAVAQKIEQRTIFSSSFLLSFPVPVLFVFLFVVGNEITEKDRKQRKAIFMVYFRDNVTKKKKISRTK